IRVVSNVRRPKRNGGARRALRIGISLISAIALLFGLARTAAWACACGCSVVDGGGLGVPQEEERGGKNFHGWGQGNQDQNWIGSSKAPASANLDKQLVTNWYTLGFSYMFSREWGVMVRGMYVDRSFTTQSPDTMLVNTFRDRDFGDTEIMGMYTGFSKDMS